MKHHVLERRTHVGWGRERFVPFGSALVGTLSAENSVLFDTLGIVFILARGRFVTGRKESTLSIWNVALILQISFLFLLFISWGFVFFHFSFRRTLHSDGQLEIALHALFISSLCRCPFSSLLLFYLLPFLSSLMRFLTCTLPSPLLLLMSLYLYERGPLSTF